MSDDTGVVLDTDAFNGATESGVKGHFDMEQRVRSFVVLFDRNSVWRKGEAMEVSKDDAIFGWEVRKRRWMESL